MMAVTTAGASLARWPITITRRPGARPATGTSGTTEIKVILTYAPPGGKLGAAAAALRGAEAIA
jgi:uncharacterized membrane protein